MQSSPKRTAQLSSLLLRCDSKMSSLTFWGHRQYWTAVKCEEKDLYDCVNVAFCCCCLANYKFGQTKGKNRANDEYKPGKFLSEFSLTVNSTKDGLDQYQPALLRVIKIYFFVIRNSLFRKYVQYSICSEDILLWRRTAMILNTVSLSELSQSCLKRLSLLRKSSEVCTIWIQQELGSWAG
jgi:hypothetical protein